ncbi:hypothetical protein SLEP1_g55682 [Rubroshorea leprosula]|uniref:Uncharacterized protein n=1 Tax=Rubroshorea leprosula TaxID=152421 RepID=A0AAV5MG83_9ROSI|nr:hypothetical protein SLEP1_g55682 [Rubroshorea leprosula]
MRASCILCTQITCTLPQPTLCYARPCFLHQLCSALTLALCTKSPCSAPDRLHSACPAAP